MIRYWCGHTVDDPRTIQHREICPACWYHGRHHGSTPEETHDRGDFSAAQNASWNTRDGALFAWNAAVRRCYDLAACSENKTELLQQLHHLEVMVFG